MKCPDCGYENPVGIQHCENCGEDMYDMLHDHVDTKEIDRSITPELKLDEPPSSHPILLYIRPDEPPLSIDRVDNLIIGRYDPKGEPVDVDLGPYGGREHGVSRKHARLDASQEPPILVDLDSYNGTFINGQKLQPDTPYQLDIGDEIRLGRLVLWMYYK
jgi:hypothetical protein